MLSKNKEENRKSILTNSSQYKVQSTNIVR